MRRISLGHRHAALGEAYQFVADNLRMQCKFEGLEELYLKSFLIRKESFDANHPDVGNTLYGLACLQRDLGVYGCKMMETPNKESDNLNNEKNIVRPISLLREGGSDDNSNSDFAISFQGIHLEMNNNENEIVLNENEIKEILAGGAQSLFEKSLSIHTSSCPPNHPTTALSMTGLADNLQVLGRLEEAHKILEDCLVMQRKVLADDHPDIARTMILLGNVLRALSMLFSENVNNSPKQGQTGTFPGNLLSSASIPSQWSKSSVGNQSKSKKKIQYTGGFMGYAYPKVLTKLS
jgi:hypothetical protein